jgi:hypothetical protein
LKRLRRLSLPFLMKLTKSGFEKMIDVIVESETKLEYLSVTSNDNFDDENMMSLLSKVNSLRTLCICSCRGVSSQAIEKAREMFKFCKILN